MMDLASVSAVGVGAQEEVGVPITSTTKNRQNLLPHVCASCV